MFPVIRVDSRQDELLEQLGTKRKFWYRDANGVLTLFKAEERGTGEDWAEKVACELCELLGLPHVQYELAHDEPANVPGVVCTTCALPPAVLILGNQLLQGSDPAYPAGTKYKLKAHTVDAVAAVVQTLQLPPPEYCRALPPGIDSALAVFAGDVMLDAWIANQDRHHENWGTCAILPACISLPRLITGHRWLVTSRMTKKEAAWRRVTRAGESRLLPVGPLGIQRRFGRREDDDDQRRMGVVCANGWRRW